MSTLIMSTMSNPTPSPKMSTSHYINYQKIHYTIKDVVCYITIVFIIIQNPTTYNILWVPM